MIIKLKKLLIYGLEKEISIFFENVQKEGYIEFIGTSSNKIKEFPSFLKNYIDAIKILKKQPISQLKTEDIKYSTEEICEKIIQTNNNIDHLEELKSKLKNQSLIVSPFGDFELNDLDFIKNESQYIFQFLTIKSTKQKQQNVPNDLIYICSEYDLDYFIAINKEKKIYSGYMEINVDTPIGVLTKRISNVENQIEVNRENLKSMAGYLSVLQDALIEKFNVYNLNKAKKDTTQLLEDTMFSVEAWIPSDKIAEFQKFISQYSVDWAVISVEKTDREPTHIENKKMGKIGEDLVKIYDIPSTNDKDPSVWVLVAFSLFFAMIVGDGGYGFIFLLAALAMKFKMKKPKPYMVRFIKLVFILSISCIVWGSVTASFFGINFKPDSPIQKISVLRYLRDNKANYHLSKKDEVYNEWAKKFPKVAESKNGKEFLLNTKKVNNNNKVSYEAIDIFNRNNLMELSLLFGVIHIFLSFSRNLRRNIAGLGWCMFLIGGYLYFPSILKATSIINFLHIIPKETAYFYGKYLLYIGIVSAVVLAFIQKKRGGFFEITHVIGVFGDVLSYLRLYALGIAGMILSQTFNEMAGSINIFLGIFILVIGHSINMTLEIMGGVIHGLRLNFLEWYNHCFEGGGKIFNPLKIFK